MADLQRGVKTSMEGAEKERGDNSQPQKGLRKSCRQAFSAEARSWDSLSVDLEVLQDGRGSRSAAAAGISGGEKDHKEGVV